MPKSILLVEDHPDALQFFEEVLTEQGYEVLVADNGRRGLEMAQANSVDALILDVMLPEMGGRQIFETLRAQKQYKNLPIIFITANRGDDVSDLLDKGPTYYMKKAIDVNRLLAMLSEALS